ncbi:MAG: AEC family transporter [Oceanicaulis sp.]
MIATIAAAFLPVFAVIAIGFGVRASGYLPRAFWRGVNALNHRLLLPAFLFTVLAGADFGAPGAARLAVLSAAGSVLLLVLGAGAARLLARRGGGAAPVIAVAVQWNFVLTLALAQRLAGPDAASLAAAVIAPGVLIGAIVTVAAFALAAGAAPASAARRVIRDPLVIAALAGLLANAAGLARAELMLAPVEMIGAGALAVILLAMGAGLDFDALKGRTAPLIAGAALRGAAAPAVFLLLAAAAGLSGPSALVLALAGAAPAAAFVYAVAADFEIETGLTAGLITLSVLIGAAVSPLAALAALAL